MKTEKQIESLKVGEKLIFHRDSGVLSGNKGDVFTFSNWWEEEHGKRWWQCKELHEQGNHEHTFSIYDVEIFDPNKHIEHNIMDVQKLEQEQQDFIEKYGA